MSLKDSWQQQRQQRQQDLAQRQQIVFQTLAAIKQERHNKASQLRNDLSLFREALASQDRIRKAILQQFYTKLRNDTHSFLTAASDRRQIQAQQLTQQLSEFIQTLRQETRELLTLATAERLTMAQQLEQELAAFTAELRADVESYLLEVATVRKNRAEQVHQTLAQSRVDRAVEMQAIFQRLAAFQTELRQYCEAIRSNVWGTAVAQISTAQIAESDSTASATTNNRPDNVAALLPASAAPVSALQNGNSLTVVPVKTANAPEKEVVAYEKEVYNHIHKTQGARLTEVEASLGINRFQTVDALRSLIKKGLITQRDRIYLTQENLIATRG